MVHGSDEVSASTVLQSSGDSQPVEPGVNCADMFSFYHADREVDQHTFSAGLIDELPFELDCRSVYKQQEDNFVKSARGILGGRSGVYQEL